MENMCREKNKAYHLEQITGNIEKELGILKGFSKTKEAGITRLPFSDEAREAAQYLKEKMQEAGMDSWIDLVGNVRGRLEATVAGEAAEETVMIGSHYDTVKSGGAYDGIAGVVCGIEIARLIAESDKPRKKALEVIAFNDEEGMMFGSGCLGSKSLTGQVDHQYISELEDENGITIEEWMKRWGSDPEKMAEQKLDLSKRSSFFEIHIEQGPVLEKDGKEIGIVDCIVGLVRCMITIEGRADHAGTTPMEVRQDAMLMASKVISHLDEIAAAEMNGSVATCGFIRAYPNAMNVVAGGVEFTLDFRSPQQSSIDSMWEKIKYMLDEQVSHTGGSWKVDMKLKQPPVYMAERFIESLEERCKEYGYSYKKMLSGAAHDAMIFADKIDTAMVFVPSRGGRSHCPEEYSDCSHLAKAVIVTCEVISEQIQ
ncbi:MAG: Zn-dependent hydrolase [Clostridia bacterium]|nr:M20 family metallo-hydrolase [Lachnospiraceae bacterium]NCC00413.1 Zn-dependent hydrolase [Clostridia bacterium]NCD02612.1 Zn-dependent hydrolase [Clostridia bacterium]